MIAPEYTKNKIFANPRANALCDLLFTKLLAQFPAQRADPENEFLYYGILLSGVAASILQGETSKDIKNITFEVDKNEIMTWLQANVGTIFNCSVINFKERILFYPFNEFYFEIWLAKKDLKQFSTNGIYVQGLSDINPETL